MIEVIRYGYYAVKSINRLSNTWIATLFGHFRYNTFIFAYILGASGEVWALYYAYYAVAAMQEKPFTIRMPNTWNFAFDYQSILMIMPLIYVYGFP
jgi:very-long-chain (3R)-3-hydroxyacyl-CoA dehydratase